MAHLPASGHRLYVAVAPVSSVTSTTQSCAAAAAASTTGSHNTSMIEPRPMVQQSRPERRLAYTLLDRRVAVDR